MRSQQLSLSPSHFSASPSQRPPPLSPAQYQTQRPSSLCISLIFQRPLIIPLYLAHLSATSYYPSFLNCLILSVPFFYLAFVPSLSLPLRLPPSFDAFASFYKTNCEHDQKLHMPFTETKHKRLFIGLIQEDKKKHATSDLRNIIDFVSHWCSQGSVGITDQI